MRFGQWLFVSMCLCACLGAAQAKMATDILKEQAELRMLPVKQLPINVPALRTPEDRLMDAIDDFTKHHGRLLAYAVLIREAARIKHDDENVLERLADWASKEG